MSGPSQDEIRWFTQTFSEFSDKDRRLVLLMLREKLKKVIHRH